jgi:predicted metal-dependent hydrolase
MTDEIKYSVIFSRRCSISLIVSPDKGVIVRAPYRTSLMSIEKFVQEKSDWIRKHLEKHSGLIRINQGKKYIDGESLLFSGRENCLKISQSAKQFVMQNDDTIEVGLNETADSVKIKSLLDKWYRQKARESFSILLAEILTRFSEQRFSPTEFVVKPLKSRWGSCSSKGRITISSELIKLKENFAEYVIIHELCHLKHHNHGKEYYRLLEKLVPDYKVVRKDLRKFLTR